MVLFTQTKAAVKSRTAKHIGAQFRENNNIDVFDTEINERDAFAAIFSIGGSLFSLPPNKVNGLERATANVITFQNEVIRKLKIIMELEKSDA